MVRDILASRLTCPRRLLLGCLLGFHAWAMANDHGNGGNDIDPKQAAIKSAFILNIARFVYWPDDTFNGDKPFDLCMLGNNPYGKAVESLQTRTIAKRRIALHIIDGPPKQDACQLLFVPVSQMGALPQDFDLPGLLTVSDLTDAEDMGAHLGQTIVSLLREDARIAIAVDRERGESRGLRFSSELLKLSRPITHRRDTAPDSGRHD